MISFQHMTLSASILITAVIFVRALFLHKLPKRAFVLLWTVALLRLLIPFSFSVDIPAIASLNITKNTASEYTVVINSANEASENREVYNSIAECSHIIGIIWLCGAAVCGIAVTVSHLRNKKRYATAVLLKDPRINAYIKTFGIRRRITVKVSGNLDSPMTTGVFRPVIYMPKSVITEDKKDEIDFVLAHELIHICRFDVLFKSALAAVLCLHWFNPFVWAMYFFAVRDIELSCDEEVLRRTDCSRSDYALSLIGLEEKRGSPITASCFSNNAVKERIEAIMRCRKISAVGIAASICLLTCSAAVFAVGKAPSGGRGGIVSAAEEYTDSSSDTGQIAYNEAVTVNIYDNTAEEAADDIQYAYYEDTEEAVFGDILAVTANSEGLAAEYEVTQIDDVCIESTVLDGDYLSGYFQYSLSFDYSEMCYVFNGKNVAGFVDDGYVFLIDGEQQVKNGIYVMCVRYDNTISGLEEITLSEFEQLQ